LKGGAETMEKDGIAAGIKTYAAKKKNPSVREEA